MRKVILFIATSLDGYIAREDGGIDWLFADQDYGYKAFYAGIDTVLMGRKTYELSLSFGEYPYPGTEGYVLSRTRAGQSDAHVRYVSGELATFVRELKKRAGKDIWLVGGADVVHECMRHDLIDEFVISIHPIVLGAGIPLFRAPSPTRELVLEGCRTFDSGLAQLTYRRK